MIKDNKQNITIAIIIIVAVITLITGTAIVEKRSSEMVPLVIDVEAQTSQETKTEIRKTGKPNPKKLAFLEENEIPVEAPTIETSDEKNTETTTEAGYRIGSYE